GAIVGHLAAFEMSSSLPNRRYSHGLDRLGYPAARPFYDEHVVADAVHENLAAVDLAGGLAQQDPRLTSDILFGAAALVELDRRASRHLLGAWARGETSLRPRPSG
ncbi:MAG TPA: iron-containing redox enzyme family protein, partial [Solirubrobacteraceae bacterium]|nr:iron-containing redox enzyme family protein [Solirubrobacteraceae bacterium]